MGEFSTEFFFDLQRFATFTGGKMGAEEETGVLSYLFDSNGKAVNKTQTTSGNTLFWDSSALVSLTPASDNANDSVGGAIRVVAGSYNTIKTGSGSAAETGYVISQLTAVDAQWLGGKTANFGTVAGSMEILNPKGTINIGGEAVTFDGGGKKSTDDKYDWEVGTKVAVSGGAITKATMTDGEEVTTKNGMSTTFTNGGTATFANKSFNIVEVFASADGTAQLNVDSDGDDKKAIVLNVDKFNTNAKEGKTAVTVSFDGQAIKSIDVAATDTADIQFSGTEVFGKDIAINKGTINVNNLTSEDGSVVTYSLNTKGSDILDLMGAGIKENKNVVVSKTGKADFLLAKDNHADEDGKINLTTIKIGDTDYKFNDADDESGNGAAFLVSNNRATGFLFRDPGDGIVISRGMKNFKLYKLASGNSAVSNAVDNESITITGDDINELPFDISNLESSGSDLEVTKNTDDSGSESFEIEVDTSADLEITTESGDKVGMAFDLPKSSATGNKTKAKITINSDGKIESVKTVDAETGEAAGPIGGTSIKITGATESAVTENFTVDSVSVKVESGNFDYGVAGTKGATGENVAKEVKLTDEHAVLLAPITDTSKTGEDAEVKITAEKEVTYNGETHDMSNGQSMYTPAPDASGKILTVLVFGQKNSSFTISEENSATTILRYIDTSDPEYNKYTEKPQVVVTPLPTISSDSSDPASRIYTVTMTTLATRSNKGKAEFTITDIGAGSTLSYGEDTTTDTGTTTAPTFTFSDDGGTFIFGKAERGADMQAHGFAVESGTVVMNAAAAALLTQLDGNEKPLFKIDGTAVYIDAKTDTYDDDQIVYTKAENSLYGLAGGTTVYDAGAITKIYAPSEEGSFTFGNADVASTDDDQVFTVYAADGDATDLSKRAYFTVEGNKAVGFTFVVDDDGIESNNFSTIKFTDAASGETFAAPVVSNAGGEEVTSKIVKGMEEYDNTGLLSPCYAFLGPDNLTDDTVTFGDGSSAKFEQASSDTKLLFSTSGKMCAILELDNEGDTVVIEKATGSVFIDGNEIDIEGGGFTYKMQDAATPSIIDLKQGADVIKTVTGIKELWTAKEDENVNGTFTIGGKSFVIAGFSSAVDKDGIVFVLDPEASETGVIKVVGISSIEGNASVTGALNGLAPNGMSFAIEGDSNTIYTYSGTSLAGLLDGENITKTGGISDFITAAEGEFGILGNSMAIEGDSTVTFSIANDALSAISDLDGAATGNFDGSFTVNNEIVKVIGDSSVAVTGDDEKVTAIANVGGSAVVLEQIGSASQVATDGNGEFNFVEGGQSFSTFSSDGVVFGLDETTRKVTSIDGIDQEVEGVAGDFSDGITVDGNLIQVENNGNIAVINGRGSGVGIFGLTDGATVGAASGIVAAISVNEGTFTFADGKTFNVAGDSMVEFVLDGEGKVVGISDVDETATVTGDLNGVVINENPPEINVEGNSSLTYTEGTLSGVVDGDNVVTADHVSTIKTDGSGTFTIGGKSYTVEDDADGVDFLVEEGTANVIGVDGLDDGAKLTGALSGISSVNGQSFSVLNDDDFGIIGAGASNGVKELVDISDGANVVDAGGASKVTTDERGIFTIGGKSFVVVDDEVEFALTDGQVNGINSLSGAVLAQKNEDFEGVSVNGQSFAINGDEDGLYVIGNDTGIVAIGNIGGENVEVQNAGGAQVIHTDKAGSFKFTKSGQSFSTTDDGLGFALDDTEKVTDIGLLDAGKDITGNFTDVDTVNGQTVRVTDTDNILTITGKGASAIAKISDVDGDAVIDNVGGASQVVTKSVGGFSFAGHSNPFVIADDPEVIFDMVEGEPAKVKGISDLDGKVEGELGEVSINGQSIAITGDSDNIFSYDNGGDKKILGKVAGISVTIDSTANADEVQIDSDGIYTFGGKQYTIFTDKATLGMNDLTITSIEGLDQDGEKVSGDFSNNIAVGGQNVQVLGDTVTVEQSGGQLILTDLSDGATIEAAGGASTTAITKEDGTFTDADNHKLTIGNGGAMLSLDAEAHFSGVSGVTGGISGDIEGLVIDGGAPISVMSASTADIPEPHLNPNVAIKDGVLSGVIPNDTVYSAGNAAGVGVKGIGEYTFVKGDDSQIFTLDSANADAEATFGIVDSSFVTAIGGIDEDETVFGALNGFLVNGESVSIKGDQGDLGVVGNANATGITAIVNVGGTSGVTIVEAAGATQIFTDTEGKFTFDKVGQKFTVAGDSSVVFGIDANESVTTIDELGGTVAGDFREAIKVDGSDIQIANDKDGVSVVANNDNAVIAISDVNAGSTVELSGTAKEINTKGAGVFTFAGNGGQFATEGFTVEGDSAITFALDEKGDVIGVDNFDNGTFTFNSATTGQLQVNPLKNDEMTFTGGEVTLTIKDSVVTGVAGADSVDGVEEATIAGTSSLAGINGKPIDITDADDSFNVVVKDFEVDKITGVTGNAKVNVADGVIEADGDGAFTIGNESYTVVDSDNSFGLKTDRDGDLSGIDSLQGTVVVEDGSEELTVNDNYVGVRNSGVAPVSIASDGTDITKVNGLLDNAVIEGALDNASIAMGSVAAGDADNLSALTVNDTVFALMGAEEGKERNHDGYSVGDKDGITINGLGAVTGLDDGARLFVTEAGDYTVNGSVIKNAVVGDTIIGSGNEGAYLYDPDNVIVGKGTPVSTIESLTGIPTTVNATFGSYEAPLSKDSLDATLEDAEVDKNQALEIFTTNDEEKVYQEINLSEYKFSKKLHLFNGLQNVTLNNEGGNLVHVEEHYLAEDGEESLTRGKKNIVLGDGNPTFGGGDVVIVDQSHDIDNEVNIVSGAGDDSIFVRNNVKTTFDMAKGGADKVVTFANANARIALENYNASTGAGIQLEQLSARQTEGGIAGAIDSGVVRFGDGVVSLTTAAGTTEVSLNSASGGTDSIGGNVVNLFTPEGVRQKVGFTHSAGGTASVEATETDDIIFIGNDKGKKAAGSILLGGLGNDTVFAGEHDSINAGGGNNVIRLEDNNGREGAFINITDGNTQIYNANNTLDTIHGDTLGVDLTTMDLAYVEGNLIIKSKEVSASTVLATVVGADKDGTLSYDATSKAETSTLAESADLAEGADTSDTDSDTTVQTGAASVASSLTPDHNYTNQLINSNGTLIKAAIGAKGSVIDVKTDEDVRANYYKGDDSGLTFYGYNGDVVIDLGGDWQTSRIDETTVALEGITSISAGTGANAIKGSSGNETFFAGRGDSRLYGDGGKNLLVGYLGQDGTKEGQTTFYVLGHAADAVDTIQAFEFINDDNYTNNDRITADKIDVDLPTNFVSRVDLSNNNLVMEVTNRDGSATESVIIEGVIDSVTGYGKDILVNGNGVVADVVAQVGYDKLNFDKFANYYNATGKNATVNVANDSDYARVWLDNASLTGTTFVGDIHVINASGFTGTAELAGNDYNNVIYASTVEGSGAASLWGGNHGDDSLYGGAGKDTFYYTTGNGTDTIYGAKDGDVVDLAGVTLDQLDTANFAFSETGVKLAFKDGGALYVGDEGKNNVQYVVQGETYFVNEEHNGFVKKA